MDGRDDTAIARGLPRAGGSDRVRQCGGGGSLVGMAHGAARTARTPPRGAAGDDRAVRSGLGERLRPTLRVLRPARRRREARRRALQRNRLRRSLSPLSTFSWSTPRRTLDGTIRIDGDAAVPVTFARTSPRPWFTTMSRFMAPDARAWSPATPTFIARLV